MTVDALIVLLSALSGEQRQYEVFFRAPDGHPRYIMHVEILSGSRSVADTTSSVLYLENRAVFTS